MTRIACVITLFLLIIATAAVANAQSCKNEMDQRMRQMAEKALQCGESADLLSSIQNGKSGRISPDVLARSCRQHLDVSGQLSAFNECSRVYVCATLAYAYALSNLSRFDGNCTAAANEGLRQYPVQ